MQRAPITSSKLAPPLTARSGDAMRALVILALIVAIMVVLGVTMAGPWFVLTEPVSDGRS